MESGSSERRGRKPRALILIENSPISSDRRVTEEARALLAHGYEVSVICPGADGQPSRESFRGIDVRSYRTFDARGGVFAQFIEYLNALVKTLWLMLMVARKPGFDVIMACNPPDLFFLIVWPFKVAGKRFIFDQHDLSPELYSSLYSRDRGFLMWILRRTERISYRFADAVIVVNESYRRFALSRGSVPLNGVFIVRNGPREGWPQPVPADASLRMGRRYLVVYMGVMGRQDGVDVLLQAIHILVHMMGFLDATFAFVGDGHARRSLEEQGRRLGVEEYVYFTGWIADEDVLSRYLVTADACVCPEPSSPLNDHSTFIKVTEYMASKTPVVAFDLPETRFSAGDAALYAQPGDVAGFAECLRDALTDDKLRAKMSAAADARIPALRWERQIPALLAAYEHALSPRAAKE